MYSNGKNVAHSGEGRLAGNIVNFVIFLVLFGAGIYSLSFWTLEQAWIPSIACFLLVSLAFAIPMHFMGRADSSEPAFKESK
ncbi:hypothetical protein OK351_06405 [Glutamicibacter sp. MNS18]|uniref:hypothetical protein n=1 Tax=Glutamicibacter sp. MNS18 TaxID=2989817 RepID=UPI0022364C9D|nr:hypothetical protein [Glutamicibacter sp. MNS18]MCW4465132.1 hypothetical protein [Glutamicibacter sp. MNS18]